MTLETTGRQSEMRTLVMTMSRQLIYLWRKDAELRARGRMTDALRSFDDNMEGAAADMTFRGRSAVELHR